MKKNKDLINSKQVPNVFNLTDYRSQYQAKIGRDFAYKKGSVNIDFSPKADQAMLIMDKKIKAFLIN